MGYYCLVWLTRALLLKPLLLLSINSCFIQTINNCKCMNYTVKLKASSDTFIHTELQNNWMIFKRVACHVKFLSLTTFLNCSGTIYYQYQLTSTQYSVLSKFIFSNWPEFWFSLFYGCFGSSQLLFPLDKGMRLYNFAQNGYIEGSNQWGR